jgi:hypothetical protein
MDEAVLQEKVGQLLSAVHRDRGHERVAREPEAAPLHGPAGMHREMSVLEDSLDHLRLAIKYLVFDLEATRRENKALRELLG